MEEFEFIIINPDMIHPAIPLWLLPILYIVIAHVFAKRERVSAKLKSHYPTRVVDWLFVPFNLGLVFFGEFVLEQIVLLSTVSLAAILWMNIIWKNNAANSTSVFHRKGRLHSVGYAHTIYSTIQLVLIGVFFASSAQQNIWFYLSCTSLILFFIMCIRNQLTQKMLKYDYKPEVTIHSIGIILVLVKIALSFW